MVKRTWAPQATTCWAAGQSQSMTHFVKHHTANESAGHRNLADACQLVCSSSQKKACQFSLSPFSDYSDCYHKISLLKQTWIIQSLHTPRNVSGNWRSGRWMWQNRDETKVHSALIIKRKGEWFVEPSIHTCPRHSVLPRTSFNSAATSIIQWKQTSEQWKWRGRCQQRPFWVQQSLWMKVLIFLIALFQNMKTDAFSNIWGGWKKKKLLSLKNIALWRSTNLKFSNFFFKWHSRPYFTQPHMQQRFGHGM